MPIGLRVDYTKIIGIAIYLFTPAVLNELPRVKPSAFILFIKFTHLWQATAIATPRHKDTSYCIPIDSPSNTA